MRTATSAGGRSAPHRWAERLLSRCRSLGSELWGLRCYASQLQIFGRVVFGNCHLANAAGGLRQWFGFASLPCLEPGAKCVAGSTLARQQAIHEPLRA
jgi:hypothetical protein